MSALTIHRGPASQQCRNGHSFESSVRLAHSPVCVHVNLAAASVNLILMYATLNFAEFQLVSGMIMASLFAVPVRQIQAGSRQLTKPRAS